MPAVQRTGQSGTGMAITIKTGVVYYTMLEYVKKNFSCILSVQDHGEGCGCADEIYDTVQTMNISQTLNYSILLIIMEAFSLIVYCILQILIETAADLFHKAEAETPYILFHCHICPVLHCSEPHLPAEPPDSRKRPYVLHLHCRRPHLFP